MKKLILVALATMVPALVTCNPAASAATHNDVKIHLKCDVTLEHAQKLMVLLEQKGPETLNVCLEQIESLKAQGYVRDYTVKSSTYKKVNETTLRCQCDVIVYINPSKSKECKLLLDTLIKDKSNLKMLHKAIEQEFDHKCRTRSLEMLKWMMTVKGQLQKVFSGTSNPLLPSSATTKLGAYVHDKYGCCVKLHEFKCEMIK